MSWFSSIISIDERIEKATSESLPTGEQDLALNLEICDLIRSKTVPPKDAMRSFKKRLHNKNPNVQLLTLHLIDICIKNGGTHFLNEIASREFMDSFVLVLKPTSGTVNRDVKELILEYLQNWANAFEGQIQLNYVNKIYQNLKSEGFQFPSGTKINSSFIDSSAPPEWVDADECMKCGTPFSFVNRKHHCRNCGGVFIQAHCNNYITLPHYGINQPVRVCDDCFDKLKGGGRPSNKASSAGNDLSNRFNSIRVSNNRDLNSSPSYNDDEDSDLQKALQLSLEEAKHPGLVKPSVSARPPPTATANESDDDEDMKAAIAASLRDMGGNAPSNDASSNPSNNPNNNLYQLAPPSISTPTTIESAPLPIVEDEFTPLEAEIIHRYVQIVEGLQRAPPGSVIQDTKLQQLNENVTALRPKLARDLRRTVEKCDQLEDLHGKLTAIVRYYDKLLEDRFSYSTKRHGHEHPGYYEPSAPIAPMQTGPPQQQQQQYQYPPGPTSPQYNQQSPVVNYANPSIPQAPYYSPPQNLNPQFSGNSLTNAPPPPPNDSSYPPQQSYNQPPPPQTHITRTESGFENYYPPLDEQGNLSHQQPPSQQTTASSKKEEEPILIEL